MKSNIAKREFQPYDEVWLKFEENKPKIGKLLRIKVTDINGNDHILVGFMSTDGIVYSFSFKNGIFYPLQFTIDALNENSGTKIDQESVCYAPLSDNLVNAIPGHGRIIDHMNDILNSRKDGGQYAS